MSLLHYSILFGLIGLSGLSVLSGIIYHFTINPTRKQRIKSKKHKAYLINELLKRVVRTSKRNVTRDKAILEEIAQTAKITLNQCSMDDLERYNSETFNFTFIEGVFTIVSIRTT